MGAGEAPGAAPDDESETDLVLKALVEPNRRGILKLVRGQERSSGEIAEHLEISRSAVSQHLGVLKAARLVSERRAGTRRYFAARPEGLRALRDLLDDLWAESLDVGRRLVEDELSGRTTSRNDRSA